MRKATSTAPLRSSSTYRLSLPLLLTATLSLVALTAYAGVLGNWQFNESASNIGITADSSGNGYVGLLAGFGPGTGLNGSGLAVFAANNANRIPTAMPLYFADDIHVEISFTYTGSASRSWTPLLGSSVGVYDTNQVFYIGKKAGSALLHVNIAGVHLADIANSGFLFDGNQHTLVLTYEKATDLLKLYADGNTTPFASITGSRPENRCIISSSTTLWIGATGHGFTGGEVWVGSIGHVIVQNAIPRPPIVITQQPTPVAAPAGTLTNLAVTATGNLLFYQWYNGTVAIPGATNPSLVFDPLRASDGGNYHVIVSNLTSATKSVAATVMITAPDTTPPTIVSVVALGSATRVSIRFSERVSALRATETISYTITDAEGGVVDVLVATLGADGRMVTLTTGMMQEGAPYTLAISGVEDVGEPPNPIADGTLRTFIHSTMVGHWPLDRNGTDLAAGNDGVIIGNLTNVVGKIGAALAFNLNATNHLVVPPSYLYDLTNLTLSTWIYIPDLAPAGWGTILEHNRWGNNWFGLWRSGDTNNKVHFRWANGSTGRADFTNSILPNRWYHVAGTFAHGIAKLYLNGILDVTITGTMGPTFAATPSALHIGVNSEGAEEFHGIIDDVRVYSRALDEREIAALANPPSLQFLAPVVSGTQLILNWTGSGRLEWAPAITGPWIRVEPSTAGAPHLIDLVPGENRFFRLNATPLP